VVAACLDGPEDDNSNCGGKNVLGSNLNHAWTVGLARREQHAKVKIVSENYEPVGVGVIEDPRIGSRRLTDRGPMDGLDSMRDKKLDPQVGSGSCQSGFSRYRERQFNLLYAPSGVCKRLANVFFLEVRIGGEDPGIGMAGR
jgi:hypothetical protein